MISAFGIDHTVSKSFPRPGVPVKAVEMSSLERTKLKRRLVWSKNTGSSQEGYGPKRDTGSRFLPKGPATPIPSLGDRRGNRQIWAGSNVGGLASRTKVVDNPEVQTRTLPSGRKTARQGNAKFNGRGGGQITLYPNAPRFDRAKTLRHEMAHVSPRRNPYNAALRMKNPYRLGKEEGRADFTASQKPTPRQYGNEDPEFNRGYDEVQGLMANARKKRPT